MIHVPTAAAIFLVVISTTCSAQPAKVDVVKNPPAEWAICTATDDISTLKGCVESMIADEKDMLEFLVSCARGKDWKSCVEVILDMRGVEYGSTQAIPEPAASPVAPPKPTWITTQSESKMDGTPTIFTRIFSDDAIIDSYGRRARPTLWLRCMENVTALLISTEWFLEENTAITYRIDRERAVSTVWKASTDNKALGLWAGGSAIPFIKSLLGREILLVRVTPYREAPREFSFSLAGLDKEIEPLRKACKW